MYREEVKKDFRSFFLLKIIYHLPSSCQKHMTTFPLHVPRIVGIKPLSLLFVFFIDSIIALKLTVVNHQSQNISDVHSAASKTLGFRRSNLTINSDRYSKTCLKWPLKKKTKIGYQDRLSLNAGQKYFRMLQGEHSAILSTFIKLPFVINIFVLSICT